MTFGKESSSEESLAKIVAIERLTVSSWLIYFLPYLISRRKEIKKIYFIDATKLGHFLARSTLLFFKIPFNKLKFKLVDIRDENGNLIRLRVEFFDFAEVKKEIFQSPLFQALLNNKNIVDALPAYLAKKIARFIYPFRDTIWRGLLIVHIANWQTRQEKDIQPGAVWLFMERRLWMGAIKNYAAKYQVEIISTRNFFYICGLMFERLVGYQRRTLKVVCIFLQQKAWLIKQLIFERESLTINNAEKYGLKKEKSFPPKLGVEYYGHLNLDRHELKSDLFFLQGSDLLTEDILLLFKLPTLPLGEQEFKETKKHNIDVAVIDPRGTTISGVLMFNHWGSAIKKTSLSGISSKLLNTPDGIWLRQEKVMYDLEYNYWFDVFARYNIKVYMTWEKFSATHIPITKALRDNQGISAIYTRSFEEFPSPGLMTRADIFFAFSKNSVEVERQSGSIIPYHVVTGYIGDHLFSLLREIASKVRADLQKHGARQIIAYSDENSRSDPRWHMGDEFMQGHYAFLLEKVLKEPWLGLVIKPKVPVTLKRRLGRVAELLEEAEATGRCFVFGQGLFQGSYPPAVAALAADIAIHGHMNGGIAGIEAALTGTPTLMFDGEGWPVSSLYKLGRGSVVFTDWNELWKSLEDYIHNPKLMPKFGQWGSFLDEFDPFRDGRAAERVGTYLKWLLDGLKAGLPREKVMADAAERYGKIWGYDKVTENIGYDNLSKIGQKL
ncbi:MAG: hypothetical protein Q8M83_01585 [bacterium]|nr:hypothetical protein [bacterium]